MWRPESQTCDTIQLFEITNKPCVGNVLVLSFFLNFKYKRLSNIQIYTPKTGLLSFCGTQLKNCARPIRPSNGASCRDHVAALVASARARV